MLKTHSFTNIGSRNKGVMWEHLTACAYRDMEVPGSAFKLTKLLSFGENESNQHCLAIDEISSQTRLIIQECEAGKYTPAFFQSVREYYQKPLARLKNEVGNISISTASNDSLLNLYKQFYISAGRTYPPMLIGFFSAYLDNYFTDALTKAIPLSGVELITVKTSLLTMPRMSFTEREDAAIVRLVKEIKLTKPKVTKERLLADTETCSQIEEIAENFGWFHMEYAGQPYSKEHYASLIAARVAPGVPIADLAEAKIEVIEFHKKFFAEHQDKKLQYITSVMQELAFILDDSKAFTIENHYVIYPILEEISRRLSCTIEDIYLLSEPELEEAIKNGVVDKSLTSKRRQYRVILLDGKKLDVFTGKEAKLIGEQYVEVPEVSSSQEIKGLVAFPGKYRGVVRLILNPYDHGKFKDGDVFVTRDGSAEFTYFLQHAGAVVADQGGIISHAAIIARESKVPTILSTKIGTKVLKDGDFVEVDAERGVVKIIKKA